jgi:hypothetical protein
MTPESIVRSFIADYCRWSDRANALTANDSSRETLELIDAEYTELLDRYCRPGFRGKNVAFASPSMHNPKTETIREVIIDNSEAVVKTTDIDEDGFESDYAYSFSLDNGRWFLEGLDYIDDEGPGPVL